MAKVNTITRSIVSTVEPLFGTIARVEIYVRAQSWTHATTVEGTVAAVELMNSPIAASRESATCGIRLHFATGRGSLYDLGGYPGFQATAPAPCFATVVRQLKVGGRARSGMAVGPDRLGIAYPGLQLHWPDGTSKWLDEPLITSIVITRRDPRKSFIEWR